MTKPASLLLTLLLALLSTSGCATWKDTVEYSIKGTYSTVKPLKNQAITYLDQKAQEALKECRTQKDKVCAKLRMVQRERRRILTLTEAIYKTMTLARAAEKLDSKDQALYQALRMFQQLKELEHLYKELKQ